MNCNDSDRILITSDTSDVHYPLHYLECFSSVPFAVASSSSATPSIPQATPIPSPANPAFIPSPLLIKIIRPELS